MSSRIFQENLLEGKVCVVSGAGSGIGRAIAQEFGELGGTVVGCGRRRGPLEETVGLIRSKGGSAEAASVDIRDESRVEGFFNQTLARHGHIDVLVNNAGGHFFAPTEQITAKGFQAVVGLNLLGTYIMTRSAAVAAFIPQRHGRVINITVSPHHGIPGIAHTSAARAGVENMTKTLSLEWGRYGVTLCAVALGAVNSEIISKKYPTEWTASWGKEVAANRVADPEEVAWFVAYLASDAASFITGTVLTFDGGRDNGLPLTEDPRWEARPVVGGGIREPNGE